MNNEEWIKNEIEVEVRQSDWLTALLQVRTKLIASNLYAITTSALYVELLLAESIEDRNVLYEAGRISMFK